MQTKFRSDIGDEFSLSDVSEKVASAQTALYGLLEKVSPEVCAELLKIHGSLGEVVYDTMTAEAA
jgi:hypothetical protein